MNAVADETVIGDPVPCWHCGGVTAPVRKCFFCGESMGESTRTCCAGRTSIHMQCHYDASEERVDEYLVASALDRKAGGGNG